MRRNNSWLIAAAVAAAVVLLLSACDDGDDFINAQFPDGGHRLFDDGRELFFQKPGMSIASISWAPDMKRFAYTEKSFTGSTRRISIHDVTNNTDRVLIENGYTPLWSPAGDKIIFYDSDGNAWYIKPDGSGKTLLHAFSPNEFYSRATWSPTGDYIAYSYRHRYNTNSYDIYTMSLTNRNKARITRDGQRDESDPYWSPDGRWIAFRKDSCSLGEQGNRTPLSLVDASGHIIRVIWKDDENEGASCFGLHGWSRDGSWVLMVIADTEEGGFFWALNVETREFRQVISPPPHDPNQRDLTATFGPDGKLYVIVENISTKQSSIWVVTPNLN